MSSHHYVKEGQEPALVVANGQMCDYEILTNLLEWCPFIVALDGAYDRLKELQITPDVVIGDLDSLKTQERSLNIDFVKIEDQETTDLEKSFDFLLSKGYTDINVVWATGNRLDHTVNNLATLAKYAGTNIVLYDNYSRCFILPRHYKKFYDKGTALSLLPIPSAEGITTKNLRYKLNNESLDFGGRSGTSNVVEHSSVVEISHCKGVLILIEGVNFKA